MSNKMITNWIVVKLKKLYHLMFAIAAYWRYGRPARKLVVIGVTGTKGKSTTCRFIASVLGAGGFRVGVMSTLEFQIGEKRWLNDKKMTMLGRGNIQKMLKEMVEAGCRYAIIETSSEGIMQNRHFGLHYDIAVFTNLGTEHSERHGGFENLRRDKGKLFAGLKKGKNKMIAGQNAPKIMVVNIDDPSAEYFLKFEADKKVGYGMQDIGGDFHASLPTSSNFIGKIIFSGASGTEFKAGDERYKLNVAGEFNVPNALAAIAVGKSQLISEESIMNGLADVKLLEGRMEFVDEGQDFKVIVDYAHEPLSLTALFKSLRNIVGVNNKVISVIGSDGGGRDIGKREKMGEIAGQLCDYVVVTDVNCFDEDPAAIAEMLAKGARLAGKKDCIDLFIEIDRRLGIQKAISLARTGDAVVITDKGTEPCMCVANRKRIPWDDRRVAREILRGVFKYVIAK